MATSAPVHTCHQCGKTGKTLVNGKYYCGRHDPVRRKERRDASYAMLLHDLEKARIERIAKVLEQATTEHLRAELRRRGEA